VQLLWLLGIVHASVRWHLSIGVVLLLSTIVSASGGTALVRLQSFGD
jgi:hypothetical protein